MFQNARNKLASLVLLASSMVAAGSASAAVDVTTVTTAIDGALVPIGAIGLSVLGVIVGIKIYKWVRRAM
jgi:energy-converting hydrogenase Eha subunit C